MAKILDFGSDIYSEYQPKVFGYLYNKVNNQQTAEDLCSDVFLKVYEKLDTFDADKASISTWIFTITRNTLTDFFRTRKVMDEVPETLAEDSSIEDDFCNREMLNVLADALETLDERESDIIVMRYYKGMTLKEICDKMDISYAYVKVLHNKALAAMRKYF